jgi:hypothetical protein
MLRKFYVHFKKKKNGEGEISKDKTEIIATRTQRH